MLRSVTRIAIASASALIAAGALAVPASASLGPAVRPHQFFYGQVIATAAASGGDVIQLDCVAAAGAFCHPAPGQSVDVQLLVPPPTNTTTGYTGNFGTEIDTDLIWSSGTITEVNPIAVFHGYNMPQPIPTSLSLPCGGSGVMSFSPSPDPDNSARASDVDVTFKCIGG